MSFSRVELISICQVTAIFVVIIACVVNLSIGSDKSVLWSSLLSGSLGYLLPAPKIKKKHDSLLHDSTQQQFSGIFSGQHSDSLQNETAVFSISEGGLGSRASRNNVSASQNVA